MTISAPNYAFYYFLFRLFDAFRITNIKFLLASNVVKMQSDMMGIISAIYTAPIQFIVRKPLANLYSSAVGLFIYTLSVARLSQPLAPHVFTFDRVIFPVSWLAICNSDFFGVPVSPPLGCFSLSLFLKFCFHSCIITGFNENVNVYPCKPDIFEATYDKVLD